MEDQAKSIDMGGGGDGTGGETERLRAQVAVLEEENDVLAVSATREPELIADVKRLTERVAELEAENAALTELNGRLARRQQAGGEDGDSAAADGGHGDVVEDPAAPFVIPVDRQISTRRVSHTLQGCHAGTNVLCARVCPTAPGIVASGGADKSLLLSRLKSKPASERQEGEEEAEGGTEELRRLRLAAPVLSMDFCPSAAGSFLGGAAGREGEGRGLLLVGGMDGSSHLVSVGLAVGEAGGQQEEDGERSNTDTDTGADSENGVALSASMKDHSKYVVVCRWAPDGSAFVTASHDKVVTLYALRGGGDGAGEGGVGGTGYEQATRLYFPEAVESVEFVSGEGGALELVISARGQPHLTYVNVETLQKRQVSLNEKEWDTHVSFTVMSLAASPDGKYLLGATDKSRTILWRVGSNTRIRTLMGHTTDDYFQPRVAWEPSGLFSYCNSSLDNDIHVHCLASGRIVDRLKGHDSVVRDMYHEPSRRSLITASYDKSVKVWGE